MKSDEHITCFITNAYETMFGELWNILYIIEIQKLPPYGFAKTKNTTEDNVLLG